jgi:hypothetical protein
MLPYLAAHTPQLLLFVESHKFFATSVEQLQGRLVTALGPPPCRLRMRISDIRIGPKHMLTASAEVKIRIPKVVRLTLCWPPRSGGGF